MRTPLNTFHNMKSRCYNPKDKRYRNYGGSGVIICEKWLHNPVSFVTWAENNGYAQGMQIHRINNSHLYSPETCEFLSREEHNAKHALNKTTKVVIPHTLSETSMAAATLGRKGGRPRKENL